MTFKKSQLQNANESLDKISNEVLEIKKKLRLHTR